MWVLEVREEIRGRSDRATEWQCSCRCGERESKIIKVHEEIREGATEQCLASGTQIRIWRVGQVGHCWRVGGLLSL
jgi:hypothetical protein